MNESAGEEREDHTDNHQSDQSNQKTVSNHRKPHIEESTPRQLDKQGKKDDEEEERRNDSVDEGKVEEGNMNQVRSKLLLIIPLYFLYVHFNLSNENPIYIIIWIGNNNKFSHEQAKEEEDGEGVEEPDLKQQTSSDQEPEQKLKSLIHMSLQDKQK